MAMHAFLPIVRPIDGKKGVGYECDVLRPPLRHNFFLPESVNNGKISPKSHSIRYAESKFYSTLLPAAEVYRLRNAQVVFNSFVLTERTEFFVWDKSGDPRNKDIAGTCHYFDPIPDYPDYCGMKFIGNNGIEKIKRAALVNGRCAINYFHWLIEYLPRILLLSKSDNIPLLARDDLAPQCKDALRLVAQGREIIWTKTNTTYCIEELLVPSMLNYSPDNLAIPAWAKSALPPDYLEQFRHMILDTVSDLPNKPSRNIFFVRHKAMRNILNIEEILHVARKYDFKFVNMATLSFVDQIKTAHSAKILTGGGGAAFANILFCQPGTKILSLLSKYNKENALFSNLARISRCTLENVLGYPQWHRKFYRSKIDRTHSMYFISPKKFESALEKITMSLDI